MIEDEYAYEDEHAHIVDVNLAMMTELMGDPAADIEATAVETLLQAQREAEEEYAHICEVEHEILTSEYPCPFKVPTGDERYPVLCAKDGRYARADYCKDCRHRNEGVA